MEDKVLILKEKGKKKVKLQNDGFGLELFTMRNGFQWAGQPVDEQLLHMLCDVIDEYFEDISN